MKDVIFLDEAQKEIGKISMDAGTFTVPDKAVNMRIIGTNGLTDFIPVTPGLKMELSDNPNTRRVTKLDREKWVTEFCKNYRHAHPKAQTREVRRAAKRHFNFPIKFN